MPARVLIVDDQQLVRAGVRLLIGEDPRWIICGEASDGREALRRVEELKPDIVILDVSMPVMNGLEAAKQIRYFAPSTKIVMFSSHESFSSVRIDAADAFVAKSSASTELLLALERVLTPR